MPEEFDAYFDNANDALLDDEFENLGGEFDPAAYINNQTKQEISL